MTRHCKEFPHPLLPGWAAAATSLLAFKASSFVQIHCPQSGRDPRCDLSVSCPGLTDECCCPLSKSRSLMLAGRGHLGGQRGKAGGQARRGKETEGRCLCQQNLPGLGRVCYSAPPPGHPIHRHCDLSPSAYPARPRADLEFTPASWLIPRSQGFIWHRESFPMKCSMLFPTPPSPCACVFATHYSHPLAPC